MAAYSLVTDLLIGDVQLGALLDAQMFVNDAADEMNVRIGMVYDLPLPVSMPVHIRTLLKMINNRIASGRLIMSAAVGGQMRELHAYGESLVRDAYADLEKILNGTIPLDGAVVKENGNQSLGPSIISGDAYSAVTAFERFAYPEYPGLAEPAYTGPIWTPADVDGSSITPASNTLDGGSP